MDPNQMPQAPFSPQPTPVPQPAPTEPYQAPVTPQPAPTVAAPQSAAIDEITTPQANQNDYQAAAAVTAAMEPQVEAPAQPVEASPEMPAAPAPETPAAPEAPAQPVVDTPQPTPAPTAPVTEPITAQAPTKSNKKKTLVPILAIACIALVFGLGFLIFSNLGGSNHKGEKALLAESIFVPKDSDHKKYALFSKDGKQLTEFNIESYSTMVAEHSLVENDNDQYGIINKDGKMTLDWQDKYIEAYGGLYRMETDKDSVDILITGDGKEVDIIKDGEKVEAPHSSPVTAVYHENVVDIYTAYGDKLDEFEAKKDDCEFSYSGLYLAVMCKGYIGIYDYYNLKKQTSFSITDKYTNFYAYYSGKIFAFAKYDDGYDLEKTAVYTNNHLYELGDLCRYISVTGTSDDIDDPQGEYAQCRTEDGYMLVDNNGKVTDIDTSDGAVYDATHYAKYDDDDREVEIYSDGKQVLKIEDVKSVDIEANHYIIRTDKSSAIYDLDGKELFKKSADKNIYLSGLDKFDHIGVSYVNDDYGMEAYLADKDDNDLTGKYSYVRGDTNGYYYLTKNSDDYEEDDLITVVDKNIKTIIDSAKCNTMTYDKYAERFLCSSAYYDDKGTSRVFDKNGKEILSAEGEIKRTDTQYHIVINDGDSEKYYAISNGTLFYTVK